MTTDREVIARIIEPYFWHASLDPVPGEVIPPDDPVAGKRQHSLERADAILAAFAGRIIPILPADAREVRAYSNTDGSAWWAVVMDPDDDPDAAAFRWEGGRQPDFAAALTDALTGATTS